MIVLVAGLAHVFMEEEKNGIAKEQQKPPLLTREHDDGGGQQLHAVVLVVASMVKVARVAFASGLLKLNQKVASFDVSKQMVARATVTLPHPLWCFARMGQA